MSRSRRDRWLSSKIRNRRRWATRDRSFVPFSRPLRFEPLEERRLLANVTVGNRNDVVDGDVTSIAALIGTPGADGISLREAILAANADNTDAADTIDFGLFVTGTIQLTDVGHVGEISVTNNLTINGPGAGLLTIQAFTGTGAAGDGARIFRLDDGSAATFKDVSISGLALTGGDMGGNGGAILSRERLSLSSSDLRDNRATGHGGAIFSYGYGELAVSDCTITGNSAGFSGGGIWQYDSNIARSTISGNTASERGGGIYSVGTSSIEGSTISGNNSLSTIFAGGGGIFQGGGAMTVTNCTISGNSALFNGGGIDAHAGTLTLRHSTITANRADWDQDSSGLGGGVYAGAGTVMLDHAIVAGNQRTPQSLPRDDIWGAVTAHYSLIGDNMGTGLVEAPVGSPDANGNLVGGPVNGAIDPVLGPLTDNGGTNETHALLALSPAIDAGDSAAMGGIGTVPLSDQRGSPFSRIADGDVAGGTRIDIGAYERQSVNLIVDTLVDEDDGDHSAGDFSLREAIAFANTNDPVPDAITFAPNLTSGGPATILLTRGELAIRDSMTIDGPGANLLSIDGGDASRIFNIDDGSGTLIDVEIVGLTLTGGNVTAGSGGALFNEETLTLSASTITGNSTNSRGGGIYNSGGILTVIGSTITENEASHGGGGIYTQFGSTTVNNSTLSGNTSHYQGGGIFHGTGGPLTIVNSTLSGNTAKNQGGGMYCGFGQLTVRHSTITGNQALGMFSGPFDVGGGILRLGGAYSTNLEHTIVAGNSGQFSGDDLRGWFTVRYSLIGRQTGQTFIVDNGGNLIGNPGSPIDPLLGPLANNGGPTMTHALFVGSPTIDAGDPNFDPADPDGDPMTDDAVPYDQRGAPFGRVFDGNSNGVARIDIGAYELQPHGTLGDYNRDGGVNAADYVVWRKTLSASVAPPFTGADGDGDSTVDPDDYGVWTAHFGATLPGAGSGSEAVEPRLQLAVSEKLPHVAAPVRDAGLIVEAQSLRTVDQVATGDSLRQAVPDISAADIAVSRQAQPDLRSPSRARVHRFAVADPGGDDLALLLAIDRVERTTRQDRVALGDRINDDSRVNDDHGRSLFSQPLTAALEAPL